MSSSQKLLNGLADLGIKKMQDHLDYYIELVNHEEKSFSEALEELVEIEKKNNQMRRDIANVKVANFPFIKTMEDFDFNFQPNINKKEMLELCNLGFLNNYENILFVGSSGVGKTHLVTAIGISCAKARNITYFITFENLIYEENDTVCFHSGINSAGNFQGLFSTVVRVNASSKDEYIKSLIDDVNRSYNQVKNFVYKEV